MNDADGTIVVKTKIDNSGLEKGLSKAESNLKFWAKRKEELLSKGADSSLIGEADESIKFWAEQVEKESKGIKSITDLAEESTSSFNNMADSIDDMSGSSKSVLGNIAKIVAALGVGSILIAGMALAGGGLSGAFQKALEDEKELKAQIDNIKNTLVEVFVPVVEKIVNFVKTLLYYIGYIVKAWTGVDIFANANKNLKDANKQAKELKKTSASFDKFNKLSANKSTSSGTSQKPISISGIDQVPGWIQWIADNKDTVLAVIAGIVAGLLAIKLGLSGIQALGIGLALYGIIQTIQNIIKFLNDPTFENFIKILKSIALAVAGVAILFGAWPVALGAAIALIVAMILEHYDKILKIFDDLVNWFETDFIGALHNLFGPIGDIIAVPFIAAIRVIRSLFESLFGGIKKIIDGIVQMFKVDFKTGITKVFGGLKDILLAPFKAVVEVINAIITGINSITGSNIGHINWFGAGRTSNGMGGRAKGGIYYPKLGVGGIINQPGRGIAYHGATIGECGAEAVVPLTDTAQMELLGESIGRHVKFNADITLELESRVLARVMKEINNEDKFARNGV